METVTKEQALDTYNMTVKNEPVEAHAGWVKAVTYALTSGDTSYLKNCPPYAIAVWMEKAKKKCISFSDEVTNP